MLMQEREFYFDQKLKKVNTENETLKIEIGSLIINSTPSPSSLVIDIEPLSACVTKL